MNLINDILIRLIDTKNKKILSTFCTNNPSEHLKMYDFCYTENIYLFLKNEENVIATTIEDINVSFGDNNNSPCIDIWINI